MLVYLDNPDWKDLPIPEKGDFVNLRAEDPCSYTVRLLVHGREGDSVRGRIENIIDNDLNSAITGGAILNNIGRLLVFERSKIFRVMPGNR